MRGKALVFILGSLLASAAYWGDAGITYTYDPAGRLIKADYGGGKFITYTYDANGNMLSRTVTAPQACTITCEATVPAGGRSGSSVAFSSVATADHCAAAPAFLWTFGDGATSAEQNTTHKYSAAGNYGWTLAVTADGVTCSKGGSIAITHGIMGDCDGDGTVSIGEVQKAINMFLGAVPPDCGVDCDGGGNVSIGELQKVINGFLGSPAQC